jgi:hypothetical protein
MFAVIGLEHQGPDQEQQTCGMSARLAAAVPPSPVLIMSQRRLLYIDIP